MRHGILTLGAELRVARYTPAGDITGTLGSYQEVFNVQKMPSLGGTVEKVETTTLKDTAHTYIPGLKDFGDMEFTLLYDNDDETSNYRFIKGLGDEIVHCQVELGDKKPAGTKGTIFEFDAILTPSLDAQEPNQALTFTCTCSLQGDITLLSNPN